MRRIYTYKNNGVCPVDDFFRNANEKIRNKFLFQLEYIKDERNGYWEPYVKHFSIEKYRQLYELRIKAAGVMVRVIFYEHCGEVILLHAFYKHDRKDMKKALDTALNRLTKITEADGEVLQELRREMILCD